MAVPPPSSDKATLRRELRARRSTFDGDADAIDRLLSPLLAREGPIAGYMAHKGEPDVLPFLLKAFHLGHNIALPLPVPGLDTAEMHFVRWHPDAPMERGMLGIAQPSGGESIKPTILLTPLVGFDRAGHRLGQGGGYYDRWFAAHPHAMRIGIAWSVQEVAALPHDPWDMPLHAIVTEKEWITP